MPNDANHTPKSKSRRGRKQKIGTARSDFTLEDADEVAKELRAKYAAEDAARRREARARGEILAKGGRSPASEGSGGRTPTSRIQGLLRTNRRGDAAEPAFPA